MQTMGVDGHSSSEVNRRNYVRRKERSERVPGHNTMWQRGRQMRENDWDGAFAQLRNETIATYIGKLLMGGAITPAAASAARFYAELHGRHDRLHGVGRREMASPAYDRGFGGQDDEIARRERDGTITEFERRAKHVRKQMRRITSIFPTQYAHDLVDRIVLDDQPIESKHLGE